MERRWFVPLGSLKMVLVVNFFWLVVEQAKGFRDDLDLVESLVVEHCIEGLASFDQMVKRDEDLDSYQVIHVEVHS
jgi:hypothetical protein